MADVAIVNVMEDRRGYIHATVRGDEPESVESLAKIAEAVKAWIADPSTVLILEYPHHVVWVRA